MTGLSDKTSWLDGEPAFEDYDIDNPPFIFGGAKDACPVCGELKQVRSQMCLPCYRTSRKEDPNWKGSPAWKAMQMDLATGETPASTPPEDSLSASMPLHLAQEYSFSPTPLDRSRVCCV